MKDTTDLECTLTFLFSLGMFAGGFYLIGIIALAFLVLRMSFA